jgi:hypothetical protein
MAPTPTWSAARSGLLGDPGADAASAEVNQFLVTHPETPVYPGAPVLTPNGQGGTAWAYDLGTQDLAQPFTLSGTTIGRVTVPLLAAGSGSSLIVELCANNAGVPGTVLTRTRIPASWIAQLSAVTAAAGAPSSSPPALQYTGNPLALAQSNALTMGPYTVEAWSPPAVQAAGVALNPSTFSYGGYLFMIGGENLGAAAYYANVFTAALDTAGNAAPCVPQPSYPVPVFSPSATICADPASGNLTLVSCGGFTSTTSGSPPVSSVYSASFDAPAGVVSAWSQQTALPTPLAFHGLTAYNGFVYAVGGETANGSGYSAAVSVAQVQNGQITAWAHTTPLPQPIFNPCVAAVDGFLFVNGYQISTSAPLTYYAPIRADGTVGPWIGAAVSALVTGGDTTGVTQALTAGGYGLVLANIEYVATLGASGYGPAPAWFSADIGANDGNSGSVYALVPAGAGYWQFYSFGSLFTAAPNYQTLTVSLTPRISVPLPTAGLTNGATYQIVLRQPAHTDLNNYLYTCDDVAVFPGNPTVLSRPAGSSTWSAGTAQHAVPIQIFDGSTAGGGQALHTWSDSGARVGTLVYGTAPGVPLVGLLDSVYRPGPVLNANPTFTTGIAPWTAAGATPAQSAAHTHGTPFSALVTPSGSATLAYLESELVPVVQGHAYNAAAWLYSPTGYSDIAVSINCYTASQTYTATIPGTATAITAGMWLQITTPSGTVPAGTAYFTIVAVEGATPASSAVFYVSTATLTDADGTRASSAAQITYNTALPATTALRPIGVQQLA